jgi:hypothetical protein
MTPPRANVEGLTDVRLTDLKVGYLINKILGEKKYGFDEKYARKK